MKNTQEDLEDKVGPKIALELWCDCHELALTAYTDPDRIVHLARLLYRAVIRDLFRLPEAAQAPSVRP